MLVRDREVRIEGVRASECVKGGDKEGKERIRQRGRECKRETL